MKTLFYKPDYFINQDGISKVEEIRIGSIKQSILVQGQYTTNPVLLFLHGGPSMPIPGVSSRGKDYTIVTNTKHLVEHFIVVFWDQRGTGKSYHNDIPQETMNIEQFVADTLELANYLRSKFNQEKIYLAAHSWGTIPGLLAIIRRPDLFYTYTGISQIINWVENDRISYAWAIEEARKRNNRKAVKELSIVGPPPYTESFAQWSVLRKWQQRFGTIIHTDEKIKHPGFRRIALDLLFSADYTVKDVYNSFVKGFKLIYNLNFIKELSTIDFRKSITTYNLPVNLIHGKKDVHVHGQLVENYYQALGDKSNVKLYWMDKSGHAFHPDDTRNIEEILIGMKSKHK